MSIYMSMKLISYSHVMRNVYYLTKRIADSNLSDEQINDIIQKNEASKQVSTHACPEQNAQLSEAEPSFSHSLPKAAIDSG